VLKSANPEASAIAASFMIFSCSFCPYQQQMGVLFDRSVKIFFSAMEAA
jgi:hypothetical protein